MTDVVFCSQAVCAVALERRVLLRASSNSLLVAVSGGILRALRPLRYRGVSLFSFSYVWAIRLTRFFLTGVRAVSAELAGGLRGRADAVLNGVQVGSGYLSGFVQAGIHTRRGFERY